jgi:hypothetical protein
MSEEFDIQEVHTTFDFKGFLYKLISHWPLDPEEYNDTIIWPDKVRINKEYIKNWSLQKDIGCLLQ